MPHPYFNLGMRHVIDGLRSQAPTPALPLRFASGTMVPRPMAVQRKLRAVAGVKHPLRPSGTSPVSKTETGEEKKTKGQGSAITRSPGPFETLTPILSS